MAKEYIDSVNQLVDASKKEHRGPLKPHLFKILHGELKVHTDLRSQLGQARSMPEYVSVCEAVAKREEQPPTLADGGEGEGQQPKRRNRKVGELEWYYRYQNQKEKAATPKKRKGDPPTSEKVPPTEQPPVDSNASSSAAIVPEDKQTGPESGVVLNESKRRKTEE
jgi:hypothetical protein